ncbi:SH3 domain and tetratricopeptide repeat-containing protein 1 isoform X2 [Nothobranchius furzeri]|uniref:SH3 domain and tetratricopeptide repeat-containing protein 1 isoform X2 n=1 Tax=Nothobranchius furzeri TaxID=105023 RepID=UPI0039047803
MAASVSTDASCPKGTLSSCEERFSPVLPVQLTIVKGPSHLPADEELQEKFKGKLRLLQYENAEINELFMELCTHLVSVDSEAKTIFVTFKTFEEIWKFTTYYKLGILGHCIGNLLLDPTVWLSSVEDEITVEVCIQEETLNLIYKGILMQEGSFFGRCSANQIFDSSTSGEDLYLEQGDLAQFEPPFLGSDWTVRSLTDGARGTSPKPALEPVIPFHQWFLTSSAESLLIGSGKPACHFPLEFASGLCLATEEYNAEGPDELTLAPGDHILIVGFLVSCFDWFTGMMEKTGQVGLIKTSLVKPFVETLNSADILLDGEEGKFACPQDQSIIKESIESLKKTFENDAGLNYKLDIIPSHNNGAKPSAAPLCEDETHQTELRENIQTLLAPIKFSSPDHTINTSETQKDCKYPSPIRFTVHPPAEGIQSTQDFVPLFAILDGRDFKEEFGVLYEMSSEQLSSVIFEGHADEDGLISYLCAAREASKKKRLFWTQTRLCLLLGKFCSGRSKFSQAQAFFEEALCVPPESFTDLRLLASIYFHLADMHAFQRNKESFFAVSERLVALLLALPDCLKGFEDNCVLAYMMRKAILSQNKQAEARACYLLVKHHLTSGEENQVVPYLERLLVAFNEAQQPWSLVPSQVYLTLGGLYSKLHRPLLSASSAKVASLQPFVTLSDCLGCMVLVLDNFHHHGSTERDILPQVAPYLYRGLSFTKVSEAGVTHYQSLSYQLTFCLSQLFYKYKMVKCAIKCMNSFINNNTHLELLHLSAVELNSGLIWLAWLNLENNQPTIALDILDSVVASLPEHNTSHQEGVVLNMRGVTLQSMGDQRRAAESYQAAANFCQEAEDFLNWAVVQANLGLLCLKAGAKGLAQSYLVKAVQLFSELKGESHEEMFISVLLKLGLHFVEQGNLDYGKGCYEWALLLAMRANLLDCQLSATRHLCSLYGRESPDLARCIIYGKHQAHILRQSRDRAQEAGALEAVSQLYLGLGTCRAYRTALDYTKRSLGIFIDLGCKEKETYGWLKAGHIYHLLGQTELVDIYIQAAQDVALSTGDTSFILKLLEASGDLFYSCQDSDRAITFYRDRAHPVAVKSGDVHCRLRLCNKLAQVMLQLGMYEEAAKFAQTAVDISINLAWTRIQKSPVLT